MSDYLRRLQSDYQSARQNLQSQATTQRTEVTRQADEAHTSLRKQASEVEREAEATKGRARTREAKEQRKRDLPFTKPTDTGVKEIVAEVSKTQAEAHAKVREAHTEVDKAKEANLAAIAQAEQEALAALQQDYDRAVAELKEFESSNVELSTGEWVAKTEFDSLTADAQAKLQSLGISGFNEWAAEQNKVAEALSSLPTQDIGGQSYYDLEAIAASSELTKLFTANVEGGQKILSDYNALASLPTTTVDGNTYYDLTKIASNPVLAFNFKKYVEGGADILADYKARASLPTMTIDNPEAQAAISEATRVYGRATIPEAVKSGEIPAKITVYNLDKIVASPTLTTSFVSVVDGGADIIANFKASQQLLAQLDSYKTEDGYNLPAFLRDNPNYNPDKLVAIGGFDQKDVNSAVDYNKQAWVAESPGETLFNAIIKAINSGSLRYDNAKVKAEVLNDPTKAFFTAEWREYYKTHPTMQRLYEKAFTVPTTQLKPEYGLSAFTEMYLEVRADSGLSEKTLRKLAEMEYTRLYGQVEVAKSTLTNVATWVFVPARALYPEVTIQDISGLEWAVGVAQVALLAVGGVGAVAPKVITSVASRIFGLGLQSTKALQAFTTTATRIAAKGVYVGATGVFVAETVANWKDMSNTQRAIAVAIDLALLAPMVYSGVKWFKARGATPSSSAAKALTAQEQTVSRELRAVFTRTYGKDFSAKYMAVDKALSKYIESLAEIDRVGSLKFKGKTIKIASLSESELVDLAKALDMKVTDLQKLKTIKLTGTQAQARAVATAEAQSEALARTLQSEAKAYVKATKGRVGFDSPTVAKMIDELPSEIVRNAKASYRAMTEGGVLSKAKIAKLRADVAKAEEALKAAQTKKPDAPGFYAKSGGSWADLLMDLLVKQARLEEALRGNIANLYTELLEARRMLAKAAIKADKVKWQAKVYGLEGKLARAIRLMEVVFPVQESAIGQRGGVVTIAPPSKTLTSMDIELARKGLLPKIKGGGVKPKVGGLSPTTITSAISVTRAITADYGLTGAEIAKVAPAVREGLQEATRIITKATPDTIREVDRILERVIQEAIQARIKGMSQPDINAMIREMLENQLKNATDPLIRSQAEPLIEPLAKSATKTATQVKPATKTKVTTKTPIPIPIPITVTTASGKERELTKKDIAGSIGWKQGFNYRLLLPPTWGANDNDVVNSRKPIPGIPYHSGVKSAYRSIVKLGGKVPQVLMRDMGIMDVTIRTTKGKPRLIFERDIKQKTRLTGVHKRRMVKRKKKKRTGGVPDPMSGVKDPTAGISTISIF